MVDTGHQIAHARKLRGISQAALADRLSCTKQTISNYERGIRKPDIDTLKLIAAALDFPVASLLGNDDFKMVVNNPGIIPSQTVEEYEHEIALDQQWKLENEVADARRSGIVALLNSGLNREEAELVYAFRLLNPDGKHIALGMVESMTLNPAYTQDTSRSAG